MKSPGFIVFSISWNFQKEQRKSRCRRSPRRSADRWRTGGRCQWGWCGCCICLPSVHSASLVKLLRCDQIQFANGEFPNLGVFFVNSQCFYCQIGKDANHAMVKHISHDSIFIRFPKKNLLKGPFLTGLKTSFLHFSTSFTFFFYCPTLFFPTCFPHVHQFSQVFSPHFHQFSPFSLGFSHFFSIVHHFPQDFHHVLHPVFPPGFHHPPVSARSSNVWTLDARLVSSDIAAGDRFGNAVKVAGAGRGIFPVIFGSLWWVIWWWFSWVI